MYETLFEREIERTRELVRSADWYLEYGRLQKIRSLGLGALKASLSKGPITHASQYATQQHVAIFEQLLSENAVRLGDPTRDAELEKWDQERQAIDRIIIHHSNRADGVTSSQLNALHLLRLYVPRYKQGDIVTQSGKPQPLYSGHFNEMGEQVFYGYHWKVQQNGEFERLLPDTAVAWHAGNWEMNKRSVGIVIDDNLSNKQPTDSSLDALATILSQQYGFIDLSTSSILGHKAVSSLSTACPGEAFENGWKQDLLERLD